MDEGKECGADKFTMRMRVANKEEGDTLPIDTDDYPRHTKWRKQPWGAGGNALGTGKIVTIPSSMKE